jgi:hypothetical protein
MADFVQYTPSMSCHTGGEASSASTSSQRVDFQKSFLQPSCSNFELRTSYQERPPTTAPSQAPSEPPQTTSSGQASRSSPNISPHRSSGTRTINTSNEWGSRSTGRSSGISAAGRQRHHSISLREAFLQDAASQDRDQGDFESIPYSPSMSWQYFQPIVNSSTSLGERTMQGWESAPFAMPCDELEQLVRK